MNPDTGEIVDRLDRVTPEHQAKFHALTGSLGEQAKALLNGRQSTTIDLNGNTDLARHAAKLRAKAKSKRKAAKASRQRNRAG